MNLNDDTESLSTNERRPKRKRLSSATIAGLLALSGCSQQAEQPAESAATPVSDQTSPAQPYNILMIAVDDLNNWPGAWRGMANTPNIDRLASQGSAFKNAHAVVPACNPSRVALMTGRRPEATGQYRNPGNFRELIGNANLETMPQFFAKQGYETVAAGKIFHKQRGKGKTPLVQSDDASWHRQAVLDIGTGGEKEYRDENGYGKWLEGDYNYDDKPINSYLGRFGIWGPTDIKTEETGDYSVAKYCSDYMQEKHDKPFFLACGLFRPHSAQVAPREYFDMYPLEDIETPPHPEADIQDLPEIAKYNFSSTFAKRVIATDNQWAQAVQGYKASTTFADDMIGVILDGLKGSPYEDNTIVVLWGDHGWQVGQKYRWEKFSLWHQGTNTPMIIKVPGMKAQVIEKPVSLLDIYPTIVKAANLDSVPEYLEGHDLEPLMKDPEASWSNAAVVTYEPNNHSVRREHWNLIQYSDGSIELYDHRNDEDEWHNLASDPQYKGVIDELKQWIPKESKACEEGQCVS
ncbi:sulfatase [Echinimonas agarilytica]|uniref:Sulfatase n=1 Tax=Echinimonas agarilytica TaxID=1215918 RepID=A0AA42B6E0_9GAMM|nr:sulfatase [Echinimonas agarilytica]MCM2678549.1 sulfatase [Echinimonas agarilytica]